MIRETGALVRHSLGRFRTPLLVMATALAAFQVVLGLAAQELQREGTFTQILDMVPAFARDMFGPLLVSMMSFSGIMALGYYHVAIVAVLVGLVIAIATEPAGEVETGFAGLVLARAVPRGAVMARSVVVLVIGAAAVVAAMAGGTLAAAWLAGPAGGVKATAPLVWKLAVSLWCVLVCWGGVSLAIGAPARRRVVAGSIAGSAAAALMLVDYLSRFWKPIRGLARLSPFHYYNPLDLVIGKPLPLGDLAILLGTGAVAITAAFVIYARRDL